MNRKSAKPDWMPQEEWDEWVAGEEERDRRLWERIKKHQAREQAEAEAAARPKRRRLFGFL